MEENIHNARRKNIVNIIAGDLNAWVGEVMEDDDETILGRCTIPQRNSRGQWFIDWCTSMRLIFANTFSADIPEMAWTYQNNSTKTQLDYILVEGQHGKRIKSTRVMHELGVGSGHRPVLLVLEVDAKSRQRPTTRRQRCSWKNVDAKLYENMLK